MKNKNRGHYCRICGELKANEKFSGKGHARHICKACSKLSVVQRNEMQKMNRITEIGMNFFIPNNKLGLLKKYAADKRYPESAQYAREILDMFNERQNTKVDEDEFFDDDLQNELFED